MDEIDLDPCPFCGGIDISLRNDFLFPSGYWYDYMCNDCGAKGPTERDSEAALTAWNRRYAQESDHASSED